MPFPLAGHVTVDDPYVSLDVAPQGSFSTLGGIKIDSSGVSTAPADIQSISATTCQPISPTALSGAQATAIYQGWMRRWHIAQRFPQPDWSIVAIAPSG